jgi:large subunit ribosomal protein L7/L12
VCAALAQRFPDKAQEYFARMRQLNVDRDFPYHLLNRVAGGEVMKAAPATAAAPAAAEDKATLDVVLAKVADPTKKIAVIKVVRELTGLGLKEAKDMVDKAPQVIKNGVPRQEAETMKTKLEKEGASVELK